MTVIHQQSFLRTYDEVINRIELIDPVAYDRTRNYLDGMVTGLSPYLTHGVISTPDIVDMLTQRYKPNQCYRLLYELAWREYFHRVWQLLGEEIFSDIRSAQDEVESENPPLAIIAADTGITAIDNAITQLTEYGLIHNHARMWIAGLNCNIAHRGWHESARWMHYHLLDGDLASNTLSWQWIAGTFSNKRYIANQDNINKFSRTQQSETFLDVPYEQLQDLPTPEILKESAKPLYNEQLSEVTLPESLVFDGTVALRSVWNLDPGWQPEADHHIVFVEKNRLARWPLSRKRWNFIAHWADQCKAKIVCATQDDMQHACQQATKVVRREYPACTHWPGKVDARDWLYPPIDVDLATADRNDIPSFSRYWKTARQAVGL